MSARYGIFSMLEAPRGRIDPFYRREQHVPELELDARQRFRFVIRVDDRVATRIAAPRDVGISIGDAPDDVLLVGRAPHDVGAVPTAAVRAPDDVQIVAGAPDDV